MVTCGRERTMDTCPIEESCHLVPPCTRPDTQRSPLFHAAHWHVGPLLAWDLFLRLSLLDAVYDWHLEQCHTEIRRNLMFKYSTLELGPGRLVRFFPLHLMGADCRIFRLQWFSERDTCLM